MEWQEELSDFTEYLKLQRGLTDNSVRAYRGDIEKLIKYLSEEHPEVKPEMLETQHLQGFIVWLSENKISPRTQARIVSGIKSFYKNLILSEKLEEDPTEQFQPPKIGRKLPTILSVEEIEAMEATFNTNKYDGVRNRAIMETIYSCGLRVSELTELKLSNLHLDKGYIGVEGKGRKERVIPIGEKAGLYINEYVNGMRKTQKITEGMDDFVFLNRSGNKLSRIMIFNIIKEAAQKAGIDKVISPHTLRHSFATHLVDGGANLRAVQQMLGHESIMTTEIYTHLDDTYLRSTLQQHHPYLDDEEQDKE